MKFCFGVLAFVRFGALTTAQRDKARQNDKVTAKYQSLICRGYSFVLSFVRYVDFHKAPKRQNDNATKWGFAVILFCRFLRFVALYKSPKRRNEVSFWHLFALSYSISSKNEQTKQQRNLYLFVILICEYFSIIKRITWLNFPSESNSYYKTSVPMRFGCWHLSGKLLFPLLFAAYTIAWQRKLEP